MSETVTDTEIKLALEINSALVRKDMDRFLAAVAQFMLIHDLTATPASVAQLPVRVQGRPSR